MQRQNAIAAVAGRARPGGVNVGVLAALIPEPTNPHDKNAVAVVIDGTHVGYLARADARRYRSVMQVVAAAAKVAYCNGTIFGGRRPGEPLQVWLEVAEPKAALQF